MLNLIIGTDWVANRDAILSRISQEVREEKTGRILIVPELISHNTERRLCSAAGDSASRFAEVLSFTRLGRRIAEQAGYGARECLDSGGRVVAMAAAARQLHSKLKAYAALETRPEFLTDLVDTVDEFKRCCITCEDLRSASAQSDGSLAQKLEELADLLEVYDGLCAHGKRDPRDQMTWVLEQLEDSSFAAEHVFYIDGFPDFTRQNMAILEHLILNSPEVTIAMNCDCIQSEQLAFEKAGKTASELYRIAQKGSIPVRVIKIESDRPRLQSLRKNLYQGKIEHSDFVQAFCTETPYEECMAAAEKIQELVRHGCRYRDITVVCPDIASYQDLIALSFHRCGIPVYLSGTEDILQKSVVATVLSALDAALGGLEQRDVLRYFRSVLSPLSPDMCDRIENYAIIWNIRGEKWTREWVNHPKGLSGQKDDESQAIQDTLNSFRESAIAPLQHLRDHFRSAKNLAGQVLAIYHFLDEVHLAERLSELADHLDEIGDNRNAQILNQLWEIILSALEQLYDVLGETIWDAETFSRLLTLLLSQYDVGTIPPVLDSVSVGPVPALRLQQEKHLFVLGALEGNLPAYGSGSGVLTDQERVALRTMGVPLTGGSMEGLEESFSEIYGVFCGASETVSVSCPAGQPSFVFRRIAEMAGGEVSMKPYMGPALSDPKEAAAYLASIGAGDDAAKLGLSVEYDTALQNSRFSFGSVSESTIRRLYGKQLYLSASKIDKAADCRMSYFLQYGLRAEERKEASVDPAEFGTYVHAVLENTAREIRDLGGFHAVDLETALSIAGKYSAAYAEEHFSQLDSRRVAYLIDRNKQELDMIVRELWEELEKSGFAPIDFEVHFSEGGKMAPITVVGDKMRAQITGYVDRVDTWKQGSANYFRVVDYKTGHKDFDYCDVFNGVGLQMLLYMFAFEANGAQIVGNHAIPAGVQYFPARAPYVSSDGRLTDSDASDQHVKTWKREGLLLRDDASLAAMQPEDAPNRLSCKRTKDGSWSGDLADREQLKVLEKYVFNLLESMVDDIASGNVEANPYSRGSRHNACAFCPYGNICHEASVAGRRNYRTMSASEFWEAIGEEVRKNG